MGEYRTDAIPTLDEAMAADYKTDRQRDHAIGLAAAADNLRRTIGEIKNDRPSGRVICSLQAVSRSGMTRRYRFTGTRPEDGEVWAYTLTISLAVLADYRMREDDLVVLGCGFDGAHSVIYRALMALGMSSHDALTLASRLQVTA